MQFYYTTSGKGFPKSTKNFVCFGIINKLNDPYCFLADECDYIDNVHVAVWRERCHMFVSRSEIMLNFVWYCFVLCFMCFQAELSVLERQWQCRMIKHCNAIMRTFTGTL